MSAVQARADERIVITQERVTQRLKPVRASEATEPDGAPARALRLGLNNMPCTDTAVPGLSRPGCAAAQWRENEMKSIKKIAFPNVLNDYILVPLTCSLDL